jgi:hypothetical protein
VPEPYKVRLRTRCGCTRCYVAQYRESVIRVPLAPFTSVYTNKKPDEMLPIEYRTFVFTREIGHGILEYVEVRDD